MTDETVRGAGTLAERLQHLIATVHPRGRGPYSSAEIVEGVNALGAARISGTYLSEMRNGKKEDPSHSKLQAIAQFFGVPVAYFYDEKVAQATDDQLALLEKLRDVGVRKVALRADGLSADSLDAVSRMLDQMRALENLPAARLDDVG